MPDTLALPRTALPDATTVIPAATMLPDGAMPPCEEAVMPFDAVMPPADVNIKFAQVPDPAPPYDDGDGDAPGTGGAAALTLTPPAPSLPALTSDALRQAAFGTALPLASDSAAASRSPSGHWPSQFAQVLAETLAGSRPASQLAPWTTDRSRRRISQLASVLATPHRPRVRRVIVTSPASGVLEMSIIAVFGNRVRALAVRLERATPASKPSATRAATPTSESVPESAPGPAPAGQAPASDPAPARRPGRPPGRVSAHADPSALAAGWYCTAIEAA